MTVPTDVDQRKRLAALLAPSPPDRRRLPDPPRAVAGARHKQLAAVEADAGPTGRFTAKISDFSLDRTGERFARHAFDDAIAAIRRAGRPVPVLFGHDGRSIGAVLGAVEADGFTITDEGLFARGWIDTTDPVGAKVRSMLRRGVLRWSIGFSDDKRHRERDGLVIDHVTGLIELSVTPVPANERVETVAMKAASDDAPEPPSHTQLEARLAREGIIGPIFDAEVIREQAREATLAAFGLRRNGDERHEGKAISSTAKTVTIATFTA